MVKVESMEVHWMIFWPWTCNSIFTV